HGAGHAVGLVEGGTGALPQPPAERSARRVAERLAGGGGEKDERERGEQPRPWLRAPQRARDVVDEEDRDQHPEREPGPREHPGHEAESVAEPSRGGRREDHQEIEEVHAVGTSSLACVWNPVWATIRWSGRTDCPSTCQPR